LSGKPLKIGKTVILKNNINNKKKNVEKYSKSEYRVLKQ